MHMCWVYAHECMNVCMYVFDMWGVDVGYDMCICI